ncbi:glycosyltransferase [Anaerorhabdus sp.]|uniref:glycosyltransferase n=1 Tax=Anaerorhabdus sp. TaxID=1872524 RepID=UPI002FC77253
MKDTLFILSTFIAFILVFYYLAHRYPTARKLFAYFSVAILVIYIFWRGFFTLPFNSPLSTFIGVIFFIAEVVGLIVFSLFILLIHDYSPICTTNINVDTSFTPSVDFLICTYNEDIRLVMATANIAKVLPYPNKKIFICDDGHRPEFESLCRKFGFYYISRPTNEHGKAGNINYALSKTNSEFFVVLDADFMVKENFIFRAITKFKDESVALVQYPQAFYNKDPFQLMNSSLYNEQELFMRFFEPALARNNALIHIGTNSIMRRSAIEKIGGIPTDSITEDMATGLLLQENGYKTIYINEVYALGITPYNVHDLAAQRQRWARGAIQVFRHHSPFKMKGLSIKQKLCYYNSLFYWLTSFQKLIYMIVPSLFLIFGIFIVNSNLKSFLLFFIPPLLLITLSFRLYIPDIRTLSTSHIYDSFVAPIHASAIIKELFIHEKVFKVTRKDVSFDTKFDYKTVMPHIILTIWLIIAVIIGLIKIFIGSANSLGLILSVGWSIFNLYGLIFAISAAKTREVINDADALSIVIDESVAYDDQVFKIDRFNYNGFRMIDLNSKTSSLFKLNDMYIFKILNYDIEISTRCLSINNTNAVFTFENLNPEEADKLSKFYSMKLYTHKPVNFCEQYTE